MMPMTSIGGRCRRRCDPRTSRSSLALRAAAESRRRARPGRKPAIRSRARSRSSWSASTETIRFSGRIDRIDLGQAGEQTVFNIVDYKSGRPSPRTSARSIDEGYSLQLAALCPGRPELLSEQQAVSYRAAYWHVAANGYQEKEAVKFQLDAAGQLRVNPEWESLEAKLRQRVRSLVEGIRRGEFPMYSADDKCTSHCEFATVCRVNQARQCHKAWQAPRLESP